MTARPIHHRVFRRCDCGRRATVAVQLRVRTRLVTYYLCDACAALERDAEQAYPLTPRPKEVQRCSTR